MNQTRRYLRKLMIVTGMEIEPGAVFENIAAALREQGAEVRFRKCPDGQEKRIYEEYRTESGISMESGGIRSLWITDRGEIARYLRKQGEYVLCWLHEGDQGQRFEEIRYAFEDPETLTAEYLERIFRRYAGLAWEILETERCLLRESTEQDVDYFYEIYKDPEITRYMENLYADPDEERAYIRNYRETVYAFYEFGVWTVIEKESGQIIGRAGLSVREGFDGAELGFVIGKRWQRRGYAYEICTAILRYGREELGIEQIQALVERENLASIKLCQKLGLQKTGEVTAGEGFLAVYITLFT